MSCSQAFSRARHRLHVIASSSDWFIGLSASVVIGKSDYFGLVFTTLNCKTLYTACLVSRPNNCYLGTFKVLDYAVVQLAFFFKADVETLRDELEFKNHKIEEYEIMLQSERQRVKDLGQELQVGGQF